MHKEGSPLLKVVALIIFIAVFVNFPVINNFPPVKAARGVIVFVTYPVQFAAYKTFSGISYFFSSIATMRSAQKQNEILKDKLSVESSLLQLFLSAADENTKLRQLLGFERTRPYNISLVAAEVISRSPNSWFKWVIINKGASDGIKPGKAVLTDKGLVGKIVEVYPGSSKVQLLTDPAMNISVYFPRTKDIGSAFGVGDFELGVKYIHSNSDIKERDEVLTSGVSQYFPKGIPVGHVSATGKKDYDLFQSINLATAADISALEVVFVAR